MCFLFSLSNSQRIFFEADSYTYEWNKGRNSETASDEIQLQLERDSLTGDISVDCSITQTYTDSASFYFTSVTQPQLTTTSLTFSGNTAAISLASLEWGQTLNDGSSPGGYSTISCQSTNLANNVQLSASTQVQIKFPPKLSIYPEKVYLPNDLDNETVYSLTVRMSSSPTSDTRISCSTVSEDGLKVTFSDQVVLTPVDPIYSVSVNVSIDDDTADPGSTVTFTCEAFSLDFQYLPQTSDSYEATLEVQPIEASLNPNKQTVSGSSAVVYLHLVERHHAQLELKCFVFSEQESPNNQGETHYSTFETDQCGLDLTGEERDIQWSIIPESPLVPRGVSSLAVVVNSEVAYSRDTVRIVCCDRNQVATNVAEILVVNSFVQMGQLALSGDVKSVIQNPEWVETAGCQCDLTYGKCDINCCCDTADCTTATINLFDCTEPLESEQTPKSGMGGYCEDSEDTNPFFCVEIESPNWIGYYFPDKGETDEGTDTGYDLSARMLSTDSSFQYSERGENMRGQIRSLDAGAIAQSERLTFPGQFLGGMCARNKIVPFLVDSSVSCPVEITQTECTRPDSQFSARNYLVSSERTFPVPLYSYFELTNGTVSIPATSTYYCARTEAELNAYLADRSVLPPLCWFNDQSEVLPPEPDFIQGTTARCANALLGAKYVFNWKGSSIVSYETTLVLGSVGVIPDTYQPPQLFSFVRDEVSPAAAAFTEPTNPNSVTVNPSYADFLTSTAPDAQSVLPGLSQKFEVYFVYNATLTEVDTSAELERSGNPGYLNQLPLRQALGSFNNDAVLVSLSASLNNIQFPLPDGSGLCNVDRTTPLLFNTNYTSLCFVELAYNDFDNCSTIASKFTNMLPAMPSNVYMGKKGNSDVAVLEDWVPFMTSSDPAGPWGQLAENVMDVLQVDPEPESGDIYSSRGATCKDVPSGYSFEFLVSDSGLVDGVVQFELVGARLRELYSDIELNCFQLKRPDLCEPNSSETQKFPFYLHTKFFTFPNPATQPRKTKSELEWDRRENCDVNENCWGNLFYPLKQPPSENRERFLLFQENTLFTVSLGAAALFTWKFTKPWTGQR